jgi:phenylpyruvate tautomerase PptA (4-oxalocrotonate tautomerase family)
MQLAKRGQPPATPNRGVARVNAPSARSACNRTLDLVIARLQQLMAKLAHVAPTDIMVILHEFDLHSRGYAASGRPTRRHKEWM